MEGRVYAAALLIIIVRIQENDMWYVKPDEWLLSPCLCQHNHHLHHHHIYDDDDGEDDDEEEDDDDDDDDDEC